MKDTEDEQKLDALNHFGFTIDENLDLKGKTVILLDDLYMSGITMQYVAMKLKEGGAHKIYGLSIVKSQSN